MSLITLKSVKIFNQLSEETIAFSAKLYWKGKLVGECSNRGCGGCNDVYVNDRQILKEMEEYAASLPSTFLDNHELKSDLDSVITDLVCAVEEEKAKKKTDKWVMKQKAGAALVGRSLIRLDTTQGSIMSTVCIFFNPSKEKPEDLVNNWKANHEKATVKNWQVV